ncbi:MAG: MFS transporter [Xanthomonadaceae bacterium]|nr:MFS transporter [Xanthomonadaceae bacterium]
MTQVIVVLSILSYIIGVYFFRNPLKHTKKFMWTRFKSWFPLAITYAFIYLARYNLDTLATAEVITKAEKSQISGWGFFVYAISLFASGPLVDRLGGKKGIILGGMGAAIFNTLMGWVLYLHLHGRLSVNLIWTLSILYSGNMFFQSFGAISTIKIKSYWFHVRERGIFGAIFGTVISLGVYFAFDWSEAISRAVNVKYFDQADSFGVLMHSLFLIEKNDVSAFWLQFFIPSWILIFMSILNIIFIKDSPDEAGFNKFETHDASHSNQVDLGSWWKVIRMVMTNRVLLMIGIVEFTSGVLRDGVMKWYRLFAKETGLGVPSMMEHWGLWAAVLGIVGSFFAGWASDKIFHSRRAPVAAIALVLMFFATGFMMTMVYGYSYVVGGAVLVMMMAVIGVHSIMSGTATADFGGRKGAATATGVADGFSKLGSALQEFVLGAIITKDTWYYWPSFLMPFTVLGLYFAVKMWKELPEATKKYLAEVEKIKRVKID